MAMNVEEPTAVQVFSFIFGVSSIAGLTKLLRSNKELTWRAVTAATLSTGLYSLGMGMVLYDNFPGHANALIGASILSGIGSQTTVEFFWGIVKQAIMTYEKQK